MAFAVVAAADDAVEVEAPRVAGGGVQAEIHLRVVVVAGGNRCAGHLEARLHAFVGHVEGRPQIGAAAPHEPAVDGAGGFSSGKSSFLNALIGEDILPTDIDGDIFKEMTHDFKKRHNVELKRLVHRVSIYTQALSSWRSLALLDTPSYSNPEDGRTTGPDGAEQRDEDIALANVLKSQFLIWVVDCEKGTLPGQDIHFIRKFIEERAGGAEGKLYLVLNKGDKKGEEDRQAILEVAEETASANEIPFAGIGVYSAHQNKWYAHQGQSFDEFLQAVDQAQSSATIGRSRVNEFQELGWSPSYRSRSPKHRSRKLLMHGLSSRVQALTT